MEEKKLKVTLGTHIKLTAWKQKVNIEETCPFQRDVEFLGESLFPPKSNCFLVNNERGGGVTFPWFIMAGEIIIFGESMLTATSVKNDYKVYVKSAN